MRSREECRKGGIDNDRSQRSEKSRKGRRKKKRNDRPKETVWEKQAQERAGGTREHKRKLNAKKWQSIDNRMKNGKIKRNRERKYKTAKSEKKQGEGELSRKAGRKKK